MKDSRLPCDSLIQHLHAGESAGLRDLNWRTLWSQTTCKSGSQQSAGGMAL